MLFLLLKIQPRADFGVRVCFFFSAYSTCRSQEARKTFCTPTSSHLLMLCVRYTNRVIPPLKRDLISAPLTTQAIMCRRKHLQVKKRNYSHVDEVDATRLCAALEIGNPVKASRGCCVYFKCINKHLHFKSPIFYPF